MKKMNIWMCGLALLAGLASCEMKNEIIGKGEITGDKGLLNLGVDKFKKTKATDVVDEFPVRITGKSFEYTKEFESYAKLQEENPIELPVGTYEIEAHSPGEYEDEMSSAYYAGKKEVTISKGVSTEETVKCKIQNVKIAISYSANFQETYESWSFTVTDNKKRVKDYSERDGVNPAPVYWKMDGQTGTICINGTATTKTGEKVFIDETVEKSQSPEYEEGDGTAFVGGDQLVINFEPAKVESSTPGVEKEGIKITVTGFNEETGEDIEIDVDEDTGGSENPGPEPEPGPEPGDDILTIVLPKDITYSIEAGNAPTSADAVITASKGLQHVIVKIEAGNENFGSVFDDMAKEGIDFNTGEDLVGNNKLADLLKEVNVIIPLPEEGTKEPYTFPIAQFFTLMDMYGATIDGSGNKSAHKFIIEAIDMDGANKTATFSVTINE